MKCLPTRRAVLAAGAMTVVGHGAVWAQESNRTYRLGVLAGLPRGAPQSGVVVADLGKAGFIVGKNLIIDWRLQGSPEQTTASVAELVRLAPDVLLAAGTLGMVAAQAATRTIPILGIADDMVASGLVPSLAHPGANLTGISMVLWIYPVHGPEEIAAIVGAAQAAGATALNVLASRMLDANRKTILDRCAALNLPAIYQWPEMAEEGGFAAYGPRYAKMLRQLARQVVKVLHGAKPADIPVEQPTEFELVINLKTAKALGLSIPYTILALADEVIE